MLAVFLALWGLFFRKLVEFNFLKNLKIKIKKENTTNFPYIIPECVVESKVWASAT